MHGAETPPKCSSNCHQSSNNKSIRNHICGECGYATSYKFDLKRHIEGVHEKIPKIKKHVCEDCGYASSHKGDLNKHIKGVHNKKRAP